MPAGYQWDYGRATLRNHGNTGFALHSVSSQLQTSNYPMGLQLDALLRALGDDAWDITATLHEGQDIHLILKRPR